jgi:putative membrane protein
MLALTAWIVSGFSIDGFWTYLGAVVVMWAVNAVLSRALDVD